MVKYIIGSLIVLYIYNTYLAPISRKVVQKKSEDEKAKNKQPQEKSRPGEYLEYEEIKDN